MRLKSILILMAILGIAAAIYFPTRPEPEPEPEPEPTEYIWLFNEEELHHILIELPNLDMSEAFVKHEDRYFYFDTPDGSIVDVKNRWGGAIQLLLEGPVAERSIRKGATEEELAFYGFTQPLMRLTLTKDDGEVIHIEVGDSVPDGHAYYIRLADSSDVYTVDYSWYDVLEYLVLDPPYPPED